MKNRELSWNVIENKGSYTFIDGMQLKTNSLFIVTGCGACGGVGAEDS